MRFVHISDTHIHPERDYRYEELLLSPFRGAEQLVYEINNLPFTPDFVLHTGDVVYDPDETAYKTARDILGQIRYPVYYLAGNHDDSQMLQRVFLQSETVAPYYYYTFEVDGVQVICLDSTGPATAPSGTIVPEQLQWLEAQCREPDSRPLVVAVHHNVLPVGIPWLDDFMRMANGEALHQALLPAHDRLRGVFSGHIHQNQQVFRDGILYVSALSSWYQLMSWPDQEKTIHDNETKPGFNVVTVTPNQTRIRQHHFSV
ncbi:MAG: metallophosphoesterase [Anaerolineae bacterium]|nr:metallophosphoesterase [Anaerolineae bacterium]